jgi:hypothetical protein
MSETSPNAANSDNNDVETNDQSATVEVDDDTTLFSLLTKLENLKVPTNDDLKEHEHILQLVLKYANIDFESSNYSNLTYQTLLTLLNYSNKTVLVPCLIKTDYPRALLKWLSIVAK